MEQGSDPRISGTVVSACGGAQEHRRLRSRSGHGILEHHQVGKVTQLSESQTRSVAAIGNSCVIPAQAGIQGFLNWAPAFAGATNLTSSRCRPGSKLCVTAELGP